MVLFTCFDGFIYVFWWFYLQGIKERQNLTGSPELGLKNAITHRDNVDDYGHLIYEALKKVSGPGRAGVWRVGR